MPNEREKAQRGAQDPNYFNPSQEGAAPSFLGYSRGIDAPRSQQYSNYKGQRLSNLGKLVDDTFSATDQTIQTGIREDLTRDVNEIRDEALGVIPTNTPAGVSSGLDELGRMTRSRNAGVMSDAHYYALLDLKVRQMKHRFAGYAPHIDQTVSQLTGVNPANALLNARQKAAAAGASSDEKFRRGYIKENDKYIIEAMPDFYNREASGKPYDLNYVQQQVAQLKLRDEDQTRVRAAIANTDASADLRAKLANQGATSLFWGSYNIALNNATSGVGKTYNDFTTAIANAQSDGEISQEENAAIRQAYGELYRVGNEFLEESITRVDPQTGRSYQQDLSASDLQNLRKSFADRMDVVLNGITNKDFGPLTLFKATMEDSLHSESYKITLNNRAANTWRVLQHDSMLGKVAPMAFNNPQFFSALQKEIINLTNGEAIAGTDGADNAAKNIPEKLRNLEVPEEKIGPATVEHTNNLINKIINGDPSDTAVQNSVTHFFGPGNQGFLGRIKTTHDQRQRLFLSMLNPAFLAKAKDVATRTGNAEMLANIDGWTRDSAAVLFRDEAREAQKLVVSPGFKGTLRFDTGSHQLIWYNWETGDRFNPSDTVVSGPVRRLNMLFQGLTNVWKMQGMSPTDITERLVEMTTNPAALGIDLSAERQDSPSLLNGILGAFEGIGAGEDTSVPGQVKRAQRGSEGFPAPIGKLGGPKEGEGEASSRPTTTRDLLSSALGNTYARDKIADLLEASGISSILDEAQKNPEDRSAIDTLLNASTILPFSAAGRIPGKRVLKQAGDALGTVIEGGKEALESTVETRFKELTGNLSPAAQDYLKGGGPNKVDLKDQLKQVELLRQRGQNDIADRLEQSVMYNVRASERIAESEALAAKLEREKAALEKTGGLRVIKGGKE